MKQMTAKTKLCSAYHSYDRKESTGFPRKSVVQDNGAEAFFPLKLPKKHFLEHSSKLSTGKASSSLKQDKDLCFLIVLVRLKRCFELPLMNCQRVVFVCYSCSLSAFEGCLTRCVKLNILFYKFNNSTKVYTPVFCGFIHGTQLSFFLLSNKK